jgi:ribonuclease III family protein
LESKGKSDSSFLKPSEVSQPPVELSFLLLGISVDLDQVQRLSPASLAYIGDAVYELYIRSWYLLPPQRLRRYHDCVVAQVRAEAQAKHLRSLEPHLMPEELEVLRRGRNAASRRSRRTDPEVYQQASSLETLVGHLYLTDPRRLVQLLTYIELELMSKDSTEG